MKLKGLAEMLHKTLQAARDNDVVAYPPLGQTEQFILGKLEAYHNVLKWITNNFELSTEPYDIKKAIEKLED